jgi:hypothetical protein
MVVSTYPLYSDNISTVNVTLSDATNVLQVGPSTLSLVNATNEQLTLNVSSVNFSDVTGHSALTTTSLALNTADAGLTLSGTNSSFELTTAGSLNLNASSVLLNGVAAPGPVGESLIANGANGLQWFSVSSLLGLEAGVYTNTAGNTSVKINFDATGPYTVPPAVVITPDADGSGNIIPVALNGVNVSSFNAIWNNSNLKKFSFDVLPINSSYTVA